MCGRYRLTSTAAELGRQFQTHVHEDLLKQRPRYNVAPTDIMPILRVVDDERWLLPSRWGLIPPWAKDPKIGSSMIGRGHPAHPEDTRSATKPKAAFSSISMINARAETASEKPAFKDALLHRRCLVVVDGVYEWRQRSPKQKVPHLITFDADERPVTLGGLWSSWKRDGVSINSFTILTTAANEQLRALHDRMPILVDDNDRDAWLDPSLEAIDLAHFARPRVLPAVRFRAVSSRLGNVKNDDDSLLVADELLPDVEVAPTTKKKATTKKPDQGDLF